MFLKYVLLYISKGIIRKLADGEFLKTVCENDTCFNECWVKCPKEFELNGYEKKNICQEKNVTAVVLLCFIKKNGSIHIL